MIDMGYFRNERDSGLISCVGLRKFIAGTVLHSPHTQHTPICTCTSEVCNACHVDGRNVDLRYERNFAE